MADADRPTHVRMKKFCCGDVVPGCTATFQADTEEQILARVARHAHADHQMASIPNEVVVAVKAHIQDAA